MPKKVILDLDIGIDDTLALIETLANPELELIGITTVYGNVARDISTQNALDLTDLLGYPDIKVYPGAKHSLKSQEDFYAPESIQEIHGANGLGNIEIPRSDRKAEEESAEDFIIRMCNELGEDLTIIATGPLTNLAKAHLKDPEALKKAGNITIMGGAVAVQGNINGFTEANINNDPEAAKIVLEDSDGNITLVGLDVTMQVMLDRKQIEKWRALGEIGNKLADEVKYYIDFYEKSAPDLGGCSLHDPLAVAVAADPTLVQTIPLNIVVDIEGEARGRTIGNVKTLREPKNPVHVAVGVDAQRFEDQLNKDIIEIIRNASK